MATLARYKQTNRKSFISQFSYHCYNLNLDLHFFQKSLSREVENTLSKTREGITILPLLPVNNFFSYDSVNFSSA